MSGDDLESLVGTGLDDEGERERLRRTHALLVAAGPPPELPPLLRVPPGTPPPAEVRTFPGGYPRRRLTASVVIAAAVALVAFGGGYFWAQRDAGPSFAIDFVLPMVGTPAAPTARASLEVGEREEAGNWPMRMIVRNLPERPDRGRYELSLTQDGRVAASCGFFLVSDDSVETVAFLNAPYSLREYDDWVVTAEGSDRILLTSAGQDDGEGDAR